MKFIVHDGKLKPIENKITYQIHPYGRGRCVGLVGDSNVSNTFHTDTTDGLGTVLNLKPSPTYDFL